jgi:hypothetical protein
MNITKEQWIGIAKVIVVALLAISSLLGYDLGIVEPRTAAYANAVRAAMPAPAAPAAPASGAQAVEGRLLNVNATGITASGYLGSATNWHRGSNPYSYADIYYSIDQGETNTITLRLDVSPDGTNYVQFVPKGDPGFTDGSATIVASNAADASAMVTAEIAFPYFKIYATVTNSELVTPTVKVYLR